MRKMWGIGLLMVALSAASAEPAPKPIHFRAHARVALDAHGVPQQVDVDQKLPAVIRKAIAQRVGQWRFEPARAGEQPRAGATTVFVDACAVPSVDGDMRLAVDYGWRMINCIEGDKLRSIEDIHQEIYGQVKALLAEDDRV